MGNDGECKIVGIGNVCLLTSIGCRLMLKDVHHVPDVRLNIISVGRLDDEGYNPATMVAFIMVHGSSAREV